MQQASILQALENDNAQIQRLLKPDAGGTSRVGSATTLDNCQLMETVHESHVSHSMPQVQQVRQAYEDLYRRCLEDKVCPRARLMRSSSDWLAGCLLLRIVLSKRTEWHSGLHSC